MRPTPNCLGAGRTARAVTAVVALVLVLLLGYFAVSPSLHQRLHTDSNRPDHFCAVIAFAKGQLSGPATISIVVIACGFCISGALPTEAALFSLFDYYFSPNRAPPRL